MARGLGIAGMFFLVATVMPRPVMAGEAVPAVAPNSATEAPAEALPAAVTAGAIDPPNEKISDPNIDKTLLLEVIINGYPTGKIGEFSWRHGKLMAQPTELTDLGFRVPVSVPVEPEGLIALSNLPGVIWNIDQRTQILHITASNASLLPTLLLPNGNKGQESPRVIESGTGMTLNYDIASTFAGGQNGVTGSLDLRGFSPRGIVSSDWLGYGGAASNGVGTNTMIRLDSTYSFADVKTLRRYSLGDFVNGGLSWNRPIHMEGAEISSDFSMRPDLVTFPLPSLSGSTAVPSTVEVLANGNQVISSQVNAGPFEIPQLPVISGAGTISMTVTNAQGQQVNVTQPFYASSTLLAAGLKTFAGQVGLVRRNWGAVSNDYGKVAGAAFYRRGLTQKFTFEASSEGTPGAFMAGAGGAALAGHLGVVNFDVAASSGSGHIGELYSAGAQRIDRKFSLGASATVANRDYRDVASMNGAGVPRKQLSGFAGLSLKRFGSAGVAYAGVDEDAAPVPVQLITTSSEHSRVISTNYSLQFHKMSFYASEFSTLAVAGNSGQNGLQVGVTIALARRNSVQVSGSSDGSGQIQAQQSAAMIGQWGYQAYVSAGNYDHEFGQAQYKSHVGLFTAGVDRSGGLTTLRLESQGALSFVDRGVFPSNTIYDSFAIVDTGSMPHIHVLQENRPVGATGKFGRLLVPDMRSFDLNHIGIEATDIPPDASFENASREIRPQDRSGVVVRFPIKFTHGALLRLVNEAGLPIALGSTVTLRATGTLAPVGYDGEAYVEGLSLHNELTIERTDGRHCTVTFDYHPLPGDIPSIGPLRCVERKP